MKTKRLIKKIEIYLRLKEIATTPEILEYVNNNTAHGSSPNAIGNVLSKNKQFEKCGMEKIVGFHGNTYEVQSWKMND